MNEQKFSDEFLNAFVDEQLAAEEKSRAYQAIGADTALNQRVCELRKLRDLVRLAYQDPPAAPVPNMRTHRYRAGSAAALLLLTVGVTLGWLLHDPSAAPPVADAPAAAPVVTAAATAPSPAAATRGKETKVLLHLNSGNPARMQEVLDEAELLLKHYRANRQIARVQIIVNGEGLNLLRADTSPYPERVSALLQKYDNLLFAACQNTIDRLTREQGIIARLLPGTVVVDSGVAQIILRQQQGWIYIQV